MTGRVLAGFADLQVSPATRVALALPLLVLLALVVPVELLGHLWRRCVERAVLDRVFGACDGDPSHEVALLGAWRCPSCGLVREGHAFARCRCGGRVAAVLCPCAMPVRNPLWDPEEDA